MQASHQFGLDLAQLCPHLLHASNTEPALLVLTASVRESQEVKGFPVPQGPAPFAARRRTAPDSITRLLQGAAPLRTWRVVRGGPPGNVLHCPILESEDIVICVAHDDHFAARVAPPPPLGPQVQHVVQIHVGEQRRYRRPLRCTFVALRPDPVLDYSRSQLLLDESQDSLVRHTMLEKLFQPPVINSATSRCAAAGADVPRPVIG